MKNYFKLGMLLLAVSLYSCGGSGDDTAKEEVIQKPNPNASLSSSADDSSAEEKDVPPSERVDMSTKGVGPIKGPIVIADEIDQELAAKGKELYDVNCTACHDPYKRLVGPPQEGILDKRTPEWIMNMIMNPEEMVQKDALAKEVFIEFNGSPMSNQGIDEAGARALLEYFRTL